MSTKKALIYEEILDRLFNGRYRFGESISVKEISEETGASRQPIMTALYRLQDNGFVKITAQVGCQVVTPTMTEVSDFFRMFASIEGLIGELASQRATAKDIDELRIINAQIGAIEKVGKNASTLYRQLNVSFHKQLHKIARSPIVCSRQLANFELSDFYLVQTGGFDVHLDFVYEEHNRIINAIESQDGIAAGKEARAHIESVAEHLLERLSLMYEGREVLVTTAN